MPFAPLFALLLSTFFPLHENTWRSDVLLRADCNGNGVLDSVDIAIGRSSDSNWNAIPDECEDLRPAQAYCGAEEWRPGGQTLAALACLGLHGVAERAGPALKRVRLSSRTLGWPVASTVRALPFASPVLHL